MYYPTLPTPPEQDADESILERKVIQISAGNDTLTALCDDGTIWQRWKGHWMEIDNVPQD